MQTLDRDQVSLHMNATPEAVYALVADVSHSRIQPEVRRCIWLNGTTGPAVGARFEAVNNGRRGPDRKNQPVVIAAQPGREFACSRTERFAGTFVWRYQFEPDGAGTMVTESYEVTRLISRLGWFIIGRLYGLRDRPTDLRAGMQQTLQRTRETAEREDGPRHTSFHASTSQ